MSTITKQGNKTLITILIWVTAQTSLGTTGLVPSSQKKTNQLLLHYCSTALIVTKETLLKLLTTFLRKQYPHHAQVIFDRLGQGWPNVLTRAPNSWLPGHWMAGYSAIFVIGSSQCCWTAVHSRKRRAFRNVKSIWWPGCGPRAVVWLPWFRAYRQMCEICVKYCVKYSVFKSSNKKILKATKTL